MSYDLPFGPALYTLVTATLMTKLILGDVVVFDLLGTVCVPKWTASFKV